MSFTLNQILEIGVKNKASDVHLKVGRPPVYRVHGQLIPLKDGPLLTAEWMQSSAFEIMREDQRQKFSELHEMDLAHTIQGIGRFRVNVFQQKSCIGMVLRIIPTTVPSFEDLNLPKVVGEIAMEPRGLVLLTGTTGSGKSTTIASMLDYINRSKTSHIVTVEDPIEYYLQDKLSVINQRELSIDTFSFSKALRAALRQDPDIILVGEMRDQETIETALLAAETGHLVLSTVHTLDAPETINRIVAVFPPHQQDMIRLQLASVLRAVISQRLIKKVDSKGRVPAVEVLRHTARVRELVEDKTRTAELHDAIVEGHTSYGMQSFDQSLMSLLKNHLITYEDAMENASNPDDFALKLSGVSSASDKSWENFDNSSDEAVKAARKGLKPVSTNVRQQMKENVVQKKNASQFREQQKKELDKKNQSSDEDEEIERF